MGIFSETWVLALLGIGKGVWLWSLGEQQGKLREGAPCSVPQGSQERR